VNHLRIPLVLMVFIAILTTPWHLHCQENPTGGSVCRVMSHRQVWASVEPLVLDNLFAGAVVGGASDVEPSAVFGPFDQALYCFHSIEVFVETQTFYRILGFDDLHPDLNFTRTQTQVIFALVGDRSVSWWRLQGGGRPFFAESGSNWRILDIVLESIPGDLPVIRIDTMNHNTTMSGQEVVTVGSTAIDFRFAQPHVIAEFWYPPLIETSLLMGASTSGCTFKVFDRELLCGDPSLPSLEWVQEACR